LPEKQPTRIDPEAFEKWLTELTPSERSTVERALARDPDLRGEATLLVADLPAPIRDGFLRRFGPAVQRAERPSVAVMEGLRGAARAAVHHRRRGEGGKA